MRGIPTPKREGQERRKIESPQRLATEEPQKVELQKEGEQRTEGSGKRQNEVVQEKPPKEQKVDMRLCSSCNYSLNRAPPQHRDLCSLWGKRGAKWEKAKRANKIENGERRLLPNIHLSTGVQRQKTNGSIGIVIHGAEEIGWKITGRRNRER